MLCKLTARDRVTAQGRADTAGLWTNQPKQNQKCHWQVRESLLPLLLQSWDHMLHVDRLPDRVRSSLWMSERFADSISGLGLSRAWRHHTIGLKVFCRGLFSLASYSLGKKTKKQLGTMKPTQIYKPSSLSLSNDDRTRQLTSHVWCDLAALRGNEIEGITSVGMVFYHRMLQWGTVTSPQGGSWFEPQLVPCLRGFSVTVGVNACLQ